MVAVPLLKPVPLDAVPPELTGGVFAIGNFDGVHRGHAVLVETARQKAAALNVPVVVLTFEPHPRSVFRPDAPVFRLTPLAAKERLFAALGMDGMVVIPFDREFSGHDAEDFVETVLLGRLGLKAAVVGYDFHFGKGRRGSPEFLADAGKRLGFDVAVIPPVSDGKGPISSTRIRAHLEQGEVRAANTLLDYHWFTVGEVVGGDRRGRELGFPTANIRLGPDSRLRHGIYAVRLRRADGSEHDAVASFGRRPTFDNGAPLLEVFVLDFTGNLYGETVVVTFIDWIRPEERFETIEALVDRMTNDVTVARQMLANALPKSSLDKALTKIG